MDIQPQFIKRIIRKHTKGKIFSLSLVYLLSSELFDQQNNHQNLYGTIIWDLAIIHKGLIVNSIVSSDSIAVLWLTHLITLD